MFRYFPGLSGFQIENVNPKIPKVILGYGSSLVSAPDLQSLITAITHAHIGYYNMIQRSYQHCDVSIWNVLAPNQLFECDIAFNIDQPNAVQKEILQLCKDLSIEKHHAAILIDADMVVDWNTYFDKAHGGTKSVKVLFLYLLRFLAEYIYNLMDVQGTGAFMSRRLLNPAFPDHIHSPLDDYWSFYFVAQWACVFNPLSLDCVQKSSTYPLNVGAHCSMDRRVTEIQQPWTSLKTR
ncbi:hypothetical protein BDP27DRAFT_1435165 [Rhodocollybia butyracea]|uniref:Fungal-type protein kinase domain-containing protein n=1 Tax=Rhodocollybia butyracea TaxID=206335 RepID=A0A9P5TWM9_9AGAR|nr:hypothetical protein BDP27DRAFT_1435165 [Rhodocollybia butyracea]